MRQGAPPGAPTPSIYMPELPLFQELRFKFKRHIKNRNNTKAQPSKNNQNVNHTPPHIYRSSRRSQSQLFQTSCLNGKHKFHPRKSYAPGSSMLVHFMPILYLAANYLFIYANHGNR